MSPSIGGRPRDGARPMMHDGPVPPPPMHDPDVWVYEEGLPHVCRKPLVEHIGHGLIVLASDLTEASRPISERAIGLAQAAGARLLVAGLPSAEEGAPAAMEARLGEIVRLARSESVAAEGQLLHQDPAEALIDLAAAKQADMIVTGRDTSCGGSRVGSLCGHLVLHAPCRVLVISTER